MSLVCSSCGGRLTAGGAPGTWVGCPHCGRGVQVLPPPALPPRPAAPARPASARRPLPASPGPAPRRPCPACGTLGAADQRFCRGCNGELQRLFNQRLNAPPEPAAPPPSSHFQYLSNLGLVAGVGLMLAGAGVLFAAVMAWDAGSLDTGDSDTWRLVWLGGLLFAGGVGSMLRATLEPE